MCAISVMIGYWQDNIEPSQWNRQRFEKCQQVLALLDDLDNEFGEPDCIDPKKAEYMKRIRAYVSSTVLEV